MKHPILTFKPSMARPIPAGPPIQPNKNTHFPSKDSQIKRIGPKFQALSEALENQRAVLQQDMQGIDPEFVLVFEVVKGVDNFIKATKRVGMDWLGDFDDFCDADEEFYETKKDGSRNDTPIKEKLYLTMTDHSAMMQMLSLWKLYSDGNPFPTGYASFRTVFEQLHDIRRWDVRDRFEETGIIQVFQNLLLEKPEKIRFEIELWYRTTLEKRETAENVIRKMLAQYGGAILKSSIHEEICYHGLIAESPANEVQKMLEYNSELIKAEQIKFIRASGQVVTISTMDDVEENDVNNNDQQPINPPVIALLDGLPLENHKLLVNRLNINDVNDYAENYQVAQRVHGTAMASLIIHGDLNHSFPSLDSTLYVRPIMKPVSPSREGIPDDEFFVDVLHKAIREIGEDEKLRSTIRIINLSIGNPNRPFAHMLSPEAKMLDYLSEKYNLVIFVSSGNYVRTLSLPKTWGEFKALSIEDKMKVVYNYLWAKQSEMKIYSPSESINAITVGALHNDNANAIMTSYRVDPIKGGYPASYSCFGGGYSRAIKPDCVNMGGRLLYTTIDIDSQQAILRAPDQVPSCGPGLKVAAPSNGLSAEGYSCGTSDANALSSRLCADFLPILRTIPHLNIPSAYESIALKTMFIHCCTWDSLGDDLKNNYVPLIKRKQRNEVIKWIGYGFPNSEFSSFCTDQRVTLMGFGSISQNMQTELAFPLPPCMVAQALTKRLTITLAWMSPIAANNKNYRLAKLSFDASNKGLIIKDSIDSDTKTSKNGTVQHEIYKGKQASTFEDGTDLKIVVSCKKEPMLTQPVKFVLMATLEVAPETNLPIYQEVEARIQAEIQVQ